MSVNTNSNSNSNSQSPSASAKHRGPNAEGSVRVLGQTAAVAGISGALLLALKAMVLVSPAVLPDSDGLDALGRPNAIVENTDQVAPVTFTPAANPIAVAPSGRSERIIERTITTPVTTTKPSKPADTTTKPDTKTPDKPAINVSTKPDSTVGKVTKPVTDLLDDVVPGVGGAVDGVVGVVDTVADPVVKIVKEAPVVGPIVKKVEETTVGENGIVTDLTKTVGKVLGSDADGQSGGSVGGLVGGLVGGN